MFIQVVVKKQNAMDEQSIKFFSWLTSSKPCGHNSSCRQDIATESPGFTQKPIRVSVRLQ